MANRLSLSTYHPFARLNRLLEGVPAGHDVPLLLSIGEPKNQPPQIIAEAMAAAAATWSRYPLPRGDDAYREACANWLNRRYALPPGLVTAERSLLPVAGSREGLYFALMAAAHDYQGSERPVVLMPNPFYHVYAGAALAVGAEPVFVPATAENGFIPDYGALDSDTLDRAIFCFLCSPSNPQGAAADLGSLGRLIELARRHDFIVAFDECYSEIYHREAPAGALQAAALTGAGEAALDRVLVFHSLSKRSSAPGLRCGFAAGSAVLIDKLDAALRIGGAGVSFPVLAAGSRLWQEESHVEANRAYYRRNFALAEELLQGRFGFATPAGGFFLWLDVGDGEAAAVRLWREAGVKVVPGAFMCECDASGHNPGARYIRVALVYDAATTEEGLKRIVRVLADDSETAGLPAAAVEG